MARRMVRQHYPQWRHDWPYLLRLQSRRSNQSVYEGDSAMNWRVSYGVVTEESAENGDFAECGMIGEYARLRDAIESCKPRTNRCDGGNWASSSLPISHGNWFSRTFDEWETGEYYTVSLHPPRNISLYSQKRLARLLGC